MQVSDFDYNLPKELIAYHPLKRGESRLLVIDRASGTFKHDSYKNLYNYLDPLDLLVRNTSKVIPARIEAKYKEKIIELVILEKHFNPLNTKVNVIVGGAHPKNGERIEIGNDFAIVEKEVNGVFTLDFSRSVIDILNEIGQVPLPAYIKRKADDNDKESYQTIFAKEEGSVAAPTASLNFTKELEEKLINKGVDIAEIVLHVGLGTFKPIFTDHLEEHHMHNEYYEISKEAKLKLIKALKDKRKITALGTTVARTLESISKEELEKDVDTHAETEIFIYPGYEFKVINSLLTNFHAPRSTVLMLAAAFTGKELLLEAYNEAIKEKYRFLSYGDSMLIL